MLLTLLMVLILLHTRQVVQIDQEPMLYEALDRLLNSLGHQD